MKNIIYKAFISSLPLLALFAPTSSHAQLIPQPWVSVGVQDSDVTYAVGAKFIGLGVELGTGARRRYWCRCSQIY